MENKFECYSKTRFTIIKMGLSTDVHVKPPLPAKLFSLFTLFTRCCVNINNYSLKSRWYGRQNIYRAAAIFLILILFTEIEKTNCHTYKVLLTK